MCDPASIFVDIDKVKLIKTKLSGESIDESEILDMMLVMLQNSVKLSDRMMMESTIKIIYTFLLKNNTLLCLLKVREKIKIVLHPINDLINNTFLTTILGWLNNEFGTLPNRTDDPPVSEETKKAMEKRAIDIDNVLQKKYKWQEENPEKDAEQKERKTKAKKEKRVFKVNNIVGVKDREHRWNMARVLYVFEDERFGSPWYYVHFHNWHDNFREWIGDPNKIKPYLPDRDNFRR